MTHDLSTLLLVAPLRLCYDVSQQILVLDWVIIVIYGPMGMHLGWATKNTTQ